MYRFVSEKEKRLVAESDGRRACAEVGVGRESLALSVIHIMTSLWYVPSDLARATYARHDLLPLPIPTCSPRSASPRLSCQTPAECYGGVRRTVLPAVTEGPAGMWVALRTPATRGAVIFLYGNHFLKL